MKSGKTAKSTKLGKQEIKAGIHIDPRLSKEVPWRKLNRDVLKEVGITGRPVMVTEYGKRLVYIVPIA